MAYTLEELSRWVDELNEGRLSILDMIHDQHRALNRILGLIEKLVERDKVDVGAIESSLERVTREAKAELIKSREPQRNLTLPELLEELEKLKEVLEKLGIKLR